MSKRLLSDEQILQIVFLYIEGQKIGDLAKKYQVSYNVLMNIFRFLRQKGAKIPKRDRSTDYEELAKKINKKYESKQK